MSEKISAFSIIIIAMYSIIGKRRFQYLYSKILHHKMSGDKMILLTTKRILDFFEKHFTPLPSQSPFTLKFWRKTTPKTSIAIAAYYSVLIPSLLGFFAFSADSYQGHSYILDFLITPLQYTANVYSGYLEDAIALFSSTIIGCTILLISFRVRPILANTKRSYVFIVSLLVFFIFFIASEWLKTEYIGYGVKSLNVLQLFLYGIPDCSPITLFPLVLNGNFSCQGAHYYSVNAYYSILVVSFFIAFSRGLGAVTCLILLSIFQIFIAYKFIPDFFNIYYPPLGEFLVEFFPTENPNNPDFNHLSAVKAHLFMNFFALISFYYNGMIDHGSVTISRTIYQNILKAPRTTLMLSMLLLDTIIALTFILVNLLSIHVFLILYFNITGDVELQNKVWEYLTLSPDKHLSTGYFIPWIKSLWLIAVIVSPVWPTLVQIILLAFFISIKIITLPLVILVNNIEQAIDTDIMNLRFSGADLLIVYISGVMTFFYYLP